MREVQSSDAKTHLTQLLSEVERGESFTITRRGRAVARLFPAGDLRRGEIEKTMQQIVTLRASLPRIPVDEIRQTRHKGHRY